MIGIDLSPRSAALARRLNPALRFVAADVHALPFAAGAAHGLVAFYSLIYTADPTPALVEMRRVLAPGAPLLVAAHAGAGAHHFDSYKGMPIDVELHLRSPDVLASQVRAAGFAVDRVEVRAPYPFEHASQRLYVTAVAA